MNITSSIALLLYIGVIIGAYLFSTWMPSAPFLAFSTQFTLGFVAYITKRLVQKKSVYNNKK